MLKKYFVLYCLSFSWLSNDLNAFATVETSDCSKIRAKVIPVLRNGRDGPGYPVLNRGLFGRLVIIYDSVVWFL